MSQIDQAFIKAYARDRGRQATHLSGSPQAPAVPPVAPVTKLTNSDLSGLAITNLFAHGPNPIAPPHIPGPVMQAAPTTSVKQPSAQPTTPPISTSSVATVRSSSRTDSTTPSANSSATVGTSQMSSRERGSSTVRFDNSHNESSIQTTRKTLTSYFQQSRADIAPQEPTASQHASPIPTVATRWSQSAADTAQQTSAPTHSLPPLPSAPPSNDFYDSIDRGEEFNAWQFQVVERGVKSTSTSDGPSAKIRNPGKPGSFLRVDPSHRATPEVAPQPSNAPAIPAHARQAPPNRNPIPQPYAQPVTHPVAQPYSKPVAQPATHSAIQSSTGFAPSAKYSSPVNPFTRPLSPPPADLPFNNPNELEVVPSTTEPEQAKDASPERPPVTYNPPPKQPSVKPLAESIAKLTLPVQPTWEVDSFLWPSAVAGLNDTQSEAIRDIGLHLQHAASKGLRTLAVTSGERGVGRSTVSMCLAKAVSKAGLRVALVDCDYECPSLVDQLNLDVTHGWQDCIFDNVPLDEVAVYSVSEKITFFPMLAAWSNSQITTHQLRINKLLKRISMGYDLVILDCNRLNGKQQTLFGLGDESVIDAALVIVDAQLSLRQRVDGAIETLRRNNVQSIGLAENFHSQG